MEDIPQNQVSYDPKNPAHRRQRVIALAHEGRELAKTIPRFDRALLERSLTEAFPDQRDFIRTLMGELFVE